MKRPIDIGSTVNTPKNMEKLDIRPFRRANQIEQNIVIPTVRPLHLEIGCGVGLHAIKHLLRDRDCHLIALDRSAKRLKKLQRRIENHKLQNRVSIVCHTAQSYVPHLPEDSLSKVFFLYPNPEWKAPNRRWFRSSFFSCLLEKLTLGGIIQLRTNCDWYAREVEILAQNQWSLALVKREDLHISHLNNFMSHFEKKYLLRGEKCSLLEFQKI